MKTLRIILKLTSFLLVANLIYFTNSCKEEIESDIVFPDSGVSYIQHVEPLFIQTCVYMGCHASDTYEQFGFSLDSYQNIFSRPGIIIHGDPDASILVHRIEGRFGLLRMPLNQPPLTDNQIKGIKTWIKEGARAN